MGGDAYRSTDHRREIRSLDTLDAISARLREYQDCVTFG